MGSILIEEYLHKIYLKVKELFTETENPLYNTFFDDEVKGFEEFKKHAEGDYSLFWLYNSISLNEDSVNSTAIDIVRRINRLYYMSRHNH